MNWLLILLFWLPLLRAHSWNYESNFEATINDLSSYTYRCLGECLVNKCVYDWHNNETPCVKTNNPTKKYMTLNNELCKSNCDYFDGDSYQWCVTGAKDWDKCNRALALKGKLQHTTSNKYLTCRDECNTHGDGYDWCHTISSYAACNTSEKVFVPNYPTIAETRCASLCKLYTDTESYCYDTNDSWQQCFLNPKNSHVLFEITNKLRKTCKFGTYDSNGYKLCRRMSKRGDVDFHECDLDVEAVAERHRLNNPSDLVRTIDPSTPITLDTDPTLSYTMLPRRGRFGAANDQEVDLPLVYQAQLTRHTLLPVGAPREPFRAHVTNNYNRMSPNSRQVTSNYDEHGHVLGSSLGGPMEMFNIFPQTWLLNRGSGSTWYAMERHIDTFLRGHNNRYVEFLAVLGYLTNRNGILINRPDHVGIRLRFHQDNYLVDRNGRRLNSFEENETEDMFFSNDPDVHCIIDIANSS